METDATLQQQDQAVTGRPYVEESMWSAFQNILTFISLAFFAGSLHALWSIFVNHWLPINENLYARFVSSYLLNSSIATLLVSAPLFVFLFISTNRKYSQQPELKKTRGKKTLNYIILIVTFIILIVRTVNAINTALNDAFTLNFGFNLLITFVVCGFIFSYYLYEVRIEKQPAPMSRYVISSIIILLVAITTFFISLSIRSDVKQKDKSIMFPSYIPPTNPPTVVVPEKTILATANNLPSPAQSVQGIDFSIESAKIYKDRGEKILELNFIFAANTTCPLTGGAMCGVNSLGIQGTDEEGFKLERTFLTNLETTKDTVLRQGEKTKGKYFFMLQDVSEKYFITYNTSSGELSDKIELLMDLK